MPNGFDRNWVRARAAFAGFRLRYGKWPTRLRLHPMSLRNLREDVFSAESFAVLSEKVELVADEHAPMVAEDGEGNAHSYGAEGFPRADPSVSVEEWLGVMPDGPGRREGAW